MNRCQVWELEVTWNWVSLGSNCIGDETERTLNKRAVEANVSNDATIAETKRLLLQRRIWLRVDEWDLDANWCIEAAMLRRRLNRSKYTADDYQGTDWNCGTYLPPLSYLRTCRYKGCVLIPIRTNLLRSDSVSDDWGSYNYGTSYKQVGIM